MNEFIKIKNKLLDLILFETPMENSLVIDLQARLSSFSIDFDNLNHFYDIIKAFWNYNCNEFVLEFSQKLVKFLDSEQNDSFSEIRVELSLYKASALACLSQMDLAQKIFINIAENDRINNTFRGISFSNLGIISMIKGNFDESIKYLQNGRDIFTSTGNSKMYVIASNYLGNVYSTIGKLDKAVALYKEGLEIKSKNEYYVLLPPTYNNLGEIYYNWGEFDKSAQYYELGLKYSEENSKYKNKIINLLENCPWFLVRWGTAPVSLISALQNDSSFFLLNLALINRSMGKNQKSLDFFKLSLKMEEKFRKDQNVAGVLFEIVYLLSEFPELDDISKYVKQFDDIYRVKGHLSPLIHQYYILMKGVLYKNKTDIRSIGKAMDIFESLTRETLQNADLIKYSHLFLLESYLKELELFENSDTLSSAIEISYKLEIISKDLSNPALFIQILIIQGKFAQIQSDFKLAKAKIKKALGIAEEKDMYRLAANIYKELQDLSRIQKIWKDLSANNTSMAEKIKMMKISPLISAISKNQSEDIASIPEFALENIKVAFFMMSDIGPELISYEQTHFIENESVVLEKIAMYYSIMLGQGNSSNVGLYGPLPIPNTPNHASIVYTFQLPHKNAQDLRLQRSTYGIISFLMPEPFIKFFIDRERILKKIESEIQKLSDISELSKSIITKIKQSLVQI